MAVEPELLCLDEPFSALDVLSAEALRGELLELWISRQDPHARGVMVTHDIEESGAHGGPHHRHGKRAGRVVLTSPWICRIRASARRPASSALVDRVYATLAGPDPAGARRAGHGAGEPGRTRGLPHITITDLADAGASERPPCTAAATSTAWPPSSRSTPTPPAPHEAVELLG